MTRLGAVLVAGAVALPSATLAEPVSTYTSVQQKDCKTVRKAAAGEGEWVVTQCRGHDGWEVFVDYDDAREALRLRRGGKEYRLPHGVSTFNSLGPRVEWRSPKKKAPATALIFRVTWKDLHTKKPRARLVVVRLAPTGACVVGTVDAHASAMNLRARHLADTRAATFACGRDTPVKVR
jgi:hypothetical protein